jgi:hypothetical protein
VERQHGSGHAAPTWLAWLRQKGTRRRLEAGVVDPAVTRVRRDGADSGRTGTGVEHRQGDGRELGCGKMVDGDRRRRGRHL